MLIYAHLWLIYAHLCSFMLIFGSFMLIFGSFVAHLCSSLAQEFDESEESTRGVDACAVDVRTWHHSARGDTSGEGAVGGNEGHRLSVYRDALADVLAERELESRKEQKQEEERKREQRRREQQKQLTQQQAQQTQQTQQQQQRPGPQGSIAQQPPGPGGSAAAAEVEGDIAGGAPRSVSALARSQSYLAAVKIQSKWRGVQARRLAQEMREELTDPQVNPHPTLRILT